MTDYKYRKLALEIRKQNLLKQIERNGNFIKRNPHVGKVIINYSDDPEEMETPE